MRSCTLFSLISRYRTARDGTQTLNDSKSTYACMHKCVHTPDTVCQVCAGPRKVLLVCRRRSQRTTLWEKAHRINTFRETAALGNSSEGRGSECKHTASTAQKLEDNVTLTHGLEVECHHLTADVPEHLGHVIRGVHPGAFGVNPAHLSLVISTVALLETSLEHSLCTPGASSRIQIMKIV